MAQHRTKREKMNASIHRVESSKLYSLSEINSSKNTVSLKTTPKIEKSASAIGLNFKTVKADLRRTAISLGIVLVLLAVGFFYLR